jgi:hypothetical protein
LAANYEGIEFAIRAGLGRQEWVLLINFPDKAEPSILQVSGSRTLAVASARNRIDGWLARQKRNARASSPPNSSQ